MSLHNLDQKIGNLGADPETGKTKAGDTWIRFRIAVNDSYRDKSGGWVKKAVWITCKAYGRFADRLAEQLRKGDTVALQGKTKAEEWEDKHGQKRYSHYLLAETGKKLDLVRRQGQAATSPQEPPSVTDGGDDDLPF